MTGAKQIVGTATRYIAGRNAVQTVYWRGTKQTSQADSSRLIKVSKTLQFKAADQPGRAVKEAHNSHNQMAIKFN